MHTCRAGGSGWKMDGKRYDYDLYYNPSTQPQCIVCSNFSKENVQCWEITQNGIPKIIQLLKDFLAIFIHTVISRKLGNTVQCITTTKVYLGGRKKKIEEELEKGGWMQK